MSLGSEETPGWCRRVKDDIRYVALSLVYWNSMNDEASFSIHTQVCTKYMYRICRHTFCPL
jgi:hypothetical protein